MSTLIQNGIPIFTDIDGDPLEDGYIYIGQPGLNPLSNPLQAYWDAALTVPAGSNPTARTKGGAAAYNGAPSRLYVPTNYSITIKDKKGQVVYTVLDANDYTTPVVYVESVSALGTLTGTKDGQVVKVKGYYAGVPLDMPDYHAKPGSVKTPNGGSVIARPEGGNFEWGEVRIVSVKAFGAVSVWDYQSSMTPYHINIQEAIDYALSIGVQITGENGRYYIESDIEYVEGSKGARDILLVVPTAFTGSPLKIKSVSGATWTNYESETIEERNPAHTGLPGRAAKEGQYISVLMDNEGSGSFNNKFDNCFFNRPSIGLKITDSIGGGWNTSNDFNGSSWQGFVTMVEILSTDSPAPTSDNKFNNCYFYNQRSIDSLFFKTEIASPNWEFNNCTLWQDGATKLTMFDIGVEWLQHTVKINGGLWETDSFEFNNRNVMFNEISINDKDEGESGSSYTAIMPTVSYMDIPCILRTHDITQWSGGGSYTKTSDLFNGNPVYNCTDGTTANIDCTISQGVEKGTLSLALSAWYKTNGTNSYLYFIVKYTDTTFDTHSSAFMRGDGKFRFVGSKIVLPISDTKTIDRIIAYVVPGDATDLSVAGVNMNSTGVLSYNSRDKVAWSGTPDNLTLKDELNNDVLTGVTVTNHYYERHGELCYLTGKISWTGVQNQSSSPVRISGYPFPGDPSRRAVGSTSLTTLCDGFETTGPTDWYLKKDGINVPSNDLTTAGELRITVTYPIGI